MGVWSGAPSQRASGVSPLENFWNSLCDLVHFCAIWWQLSVGRWTRYICNFATEVEPICQLQSPHDRTAVLSLLSNEHALKSRTFSVPGMVLPGRGTTWHKSGTSREIRDGWQPYFQYAVIKSISCTASDIIPHSKCMWVTVTLKSLSVSTIKPNLQAISSFQFTRKHITNTEFEYKLQFPRYDRYEGFKYSKSGLKVTQSNVTSNGAIR